MCACVGVYVCASACLCIGVCKCQCVSLFVFVYVCVCARRLCVLFLLLALVYSSLRRLTPMLNGTNCLCQYQQQNSIMLIRHSANVVLTQSSPTTKQYHADTRPSLKCKQRYNRYCDKIITLSKQPPLDAIKEMLVSNYVVKKSKERIRTRLPARQCLQNWRNQYSSE